MKHQIIFSTLHIPWPFFRQTEDSMGKWDDAQYIFHPENNVDSCDFLVVYDEPHRPIITTIAWENRILFIGEPPSIRSYPLQYLNQFGIVICPYNLGDIKGRQIKTHTSLPWHFGVTRSDANDAFMDFSHLSSMPAPQKKPGISVVCSNKAITPEHVQRLHFLEKLKEAIGNKLHVFGRGFKEIDDKADAVLPYEFHLVLENNTVPHFWTEKTADAFLGYSYPVFSGCPNIHDYFSTDALTAINIANTDQAIQAIKTILDTPGFYQNHLGNIQAARKQVMTEYNVFPVINSILENALVKKEPKTIIYTSVHFNPSNQPHVKVAMFISKIAKKFFKLLKNPFLIRKTPSAISNFRPLRVFKRIFGDNILKRIP